MDFLRKFIETAFCFYNCDLIGRVMNGNQPISNKELIINKTPLFPLCAGIIQKCRMTA